MTGRIVGNLDPLFDYWKAIALPNDQIAWANEELKRERPDPEATAVLTRAADAGNAFAMCRLSSYYASEGRSQFSPEKAARWAKQAVSLDFAPARFLLGWYCEFGIGMPIDLEAAKTNYEVSAELGFSLAATRLALGLADGQFGKDYHRAMELLSLAAANGDSTAAVQLAQWYEDGVGVVADSAKALSWYERAAVLGSSIANLRLSMAYSNGDLGVRKDTKKADQYLDASKRGNP